MSCRGAVSDPPRCPRGDWLNWLGFGFGRGGGGVLIGWHCAKVQGHAELEIEKPRVKTLSYDFPKLQHSKTNSFCANVHLRQSFWKTVKVTKRSRDVTPRSKYQKSKESMVPLCLKFGAIPTIIYKVTAFWKKWHTSFFLIGRHLESVSRTIPAGPRNFSPIRAFFYRVIVLTSQDAVFVPGQRSKVT